MRRHCACRLCSAWARLSFLQVWSVRRVTPSICASFSHPATKLPDSPSSSSEAISSSLSLSLFDSGFPFERRETTTFVFAARSFLAVCGVMPSMLISVSFAIIMRASQKTGNRIAGSFPFLSGNLPYIKKPAILYKHRDRGRHIDGKFRLNGKFDGKRIFPCFKI